MLYTYSHGMPEKLNMCFLSKMCLINMFFHVNIIRTNWTCFRVPINVHCSLRTHGVSRYGNIRNRFIPVLSDFPNYSTVNCKMPCHRILWWDENWTFPFIHHSLGKWKLSGETMILVLTRCLRITSTLSGMRQLLCHICIAHNSSACLIYV